MIKNKQLKEGDYFEALQFAGCFAEKDFDKNFIKEYYKILPTEVAFEAGPKYLIKKTKSVLTNPKQIIHFLNKILKMVIYKIKK